MCLLSGSTCTAGTGRASSSRTCTVIGWEGSVSFDLFLSELISCRVTMEHGILWDGSQISTNQKRESTIFSLLIGQNLAYLTKLGNIVI